MRATDGHTSNPAIKPLWMALPASFGPDPLLRHGLTLTLAMAALHASNWLYHMLMSRALGPAGYGGLSALLGLILILTVPVSTLQMGLAALVARVHASGGEALFRNVLLRNLRGFVLFGGALSGILILFSPVVADVLRLTSPAPVVIAGTVLISWTVLPVLRGIDQGLQRFGPLGLSLATEGLIKLAMGVTLVAHGLGLSGAVGGVSLGALGSIAVTLLAARKSSRPGPQAGEIDQPLLRLVFPYIVAIGCFSILTQADVMLVKALHPAHEAGLYAAASTGGKIILYLTTPLAMVLLPEVARRHALRQDGREILMRSAFLACVTGGPLVVLYFLAPATVIRLLFGTAYVEAASLLGLLGLGMLAYELALLGVYYKLGLHQPGVLQWIGLLTLVFPVLIAALGRSVQMVAILVAILGILACGGVWSSLSLADRSRLDTGS